MLATTHTLVGAAVGGRLGNPYLALVSGVVLHFLFDKILHFWPEKRIYRGVILAFDWIFCLGFIVYTFVQKDYPVFAGALGGFGVDFVLLSFAPIRRSWIGKFHIRIQHHKRNILYIFGDIGIIVLAVLVLIKLG